MLPSGFTIPFLQSVQALPHIFNDCFITINLRNLHIHFRVSQIRDIFADPGGFEPDQVLDTVPFRY
jgi:hypothetical protein